MDPGGVKTGRMVTGIGIWCEITDGLWLRGINGREMKEKETGVYYKRRKQHVNFLNLKLDAQVCYIKDLVRRRSSI